MPRGTVTMYSLSDIVPVLYMDKSSRYHYHRDIIIDNNNAIIAITRMAKRYHCNCLCPTFRIMLNIGMKLHTILVSTSTVPVRAVVLCFVF